VEIIGNEVKRILKVIKMIILVFVIDFILFSPK